MKPLEVTRTRPRLGLTLHKVSVHRVAEEARHVAARSRREGFITRVLKRDIKADGLAITVYVATSWKGAR